MVRLKVIARNPSSTAACEISIPYGAIKRNNWGAAYINFSEFQFLMVRLKA